MAKITSGKGNSANIKILLKDDKNNNLINGI